MTLEIGSLFVLLAVMVYLFLTERIPVDLTAFLGLVVLVFAGFVTPAEAFEGFSSRAVITLLSVFIVSGALAETGVAERVGGSIHRIAGSNEVALLATLMVVAGLLSAFMPNIAVTAVLMPAVATLGPRAGLAPSRLFMPLAFAATLGGMTTLVGTAPNIVAGQLMAERGLQPFELFDFAPVGVAVMLLGVAFMLTLGRRLLPTRERGWPSDRRSTDLGSVYQLEERLFSLRLPEDSPVDGRTLAETRLGNALGVKVVSIQRGSRRFDVDGSTRLRGGDVLIVDGEADRVRDFLEMERLEVLSLPASGIPELSPEIQGIRVKVTTPSPLAGQTLRELDFRRRFGVVVLAIRHRGKLFLDHLALQTLRVEDEVLAVGLEGDLERFAEEPGWEVLQTGLPAVAELARRLHVIDVSEQSELCGSTIAGSRLGEIAGLTVAGIVRDGTARLALSPDETLRAGDRLLLVADSHAVDALTDLRGIELGPTVGREQLETEEATMVEAAVAPRSFAEGRTLDELDFQRRYGLLALALWRQGEPRHTDLAHVPLHFGDALLLHGSRDNIQRLASDPDFVVLSEAAQGLRRQAKAPFALGGLALMIGLVLAGIQPIHVAAFTAASLVVLAGALSMKEVYRVVEWRVVFLVAAVLPMGTAMERTGAADLIADWVSALTGPLGPYAVLVTLVLLGSLFSQCLDGAPAVVLLAPIALQMADQLRISPYPLMMGLTLAASVAFMTPFSQKGNLLVMGAGGYRPRDYLRVGTPLTVLLFGLLVLLIPVFFPF